MTRGMIAGVLCAWLVAGCADPHQPVQRRTIKKSDQARGHGSASLSEPISPHGSASPHGMPGAMFPAHGRPSGGVADPGLGPIVRLGSLAMVEPEGWVRERPTPRIIQGQDFTPDAEFRLPRAGEDEIDGHLTVSTLRGGVARNVDRWRDQFAEQGREFSQEELDVGGVSVVVVDISGTLVMMGGPHGGTGGGIPNMRMLGAIIPGQTVSHFVKARGQKDTIAKHEQSFRRFIESLKPAEDIEKPPAADDDASENAAEEQSDV